MRAMRAWYDSALASDATRYSRALLGVLLVLWLLGQLFGRYATDLFALTPGYTLSNYYLWTFVTAGLYDNSFGVGLLNIAVYAAVAPMLERSWGGLSFVKFVAVTNLCVTVSIFFNMVACYAATEYEPCLYRAVCGFSGINAAFAVALKQKFGERPCVPGVRVLDLIKFKHLPMFLGAVSLLLWLVGRLGGKEAPLIFFGTFYAWVYLRFFLTDATTGVVGDLRPEFALATFFPDVAGVRPLVDFAASVVFTTLRSVGLFADVVRTNASLPSSNEDGSTATLLGGGTGSISNAALSSASDPYRSVADPTAERRRLLAIRAIDEKLAELARQPQNPLPFPGDASGSLVSAGPAAGVLDSSLPYSPEGTVPAGTAAAGHLSPAEAASSAALVAAALPSEEEMAQMEAALTQPATAAAAASPPAQ